MALLAQILDRLRRRPPDGEGAANVDNASLTKRYRRRRAVFHKIYHSMPTILILLYIVGYTWMLLLPSSLFGHQIYIDENGLQPGQVTTYWSWGDVHSSDVFLGQLEQLRDRNASSAERALYIKSAFNDLGIPAATQAYAFRTGNLPLNGINTYAVLSAPRTSGTEAIVIAASWTSLNGQPNLRGIATVLGLVSFVKKYSLWAKDIVFVISDGYMDGMQAWLAAYHGLEQSNLDTELLHLRSGVIWTALTIDYPGHSFSHLGVFYEGLNGRLPNQDLMNSLNIISTYTANVPVVLYNHLDEQINDVLPEWLPQSVQNLKEFRNYAIRAHNLVKHIRYQAFGRASGIHGLFNRYRIDAITLFAVPATGPHGFHAMGRIVESALRTMNNLLERLHASFFFYLLTGPGTFLKIGEYLPSAVIVSIAMIFGGLQIWVDAGWVEQRPVINEKSQEKNTVPATVKWKTRHRNALLPLAIMLVTHVIGGLTFLLATSTWFMKLPTSGTSYLPLIPFSLIVFSTLSALLTSPDRKLVQVDSSPAPLHTLLKAFNLCLASTVISITSVLNFSLAAALAILLGVPLSLASPTRGLPNKIVKALSYYVILFPLWWILFSRPISQPIWDWQVLGIWFAPFVCIVYWPLVLQAMIICMLDP